MASEILPGAEPLSVDGGEVGVLVCHGYTGTPQSMRGVAEYLAGEGRLSVRLPLLPGHGTRVEDMAGATAGDWVECVTRSFNELRERCSSVFVLGLSMGGTLALHLAGMYPEAVAGVVPINAPVSFPTADLAALAFDPQAPDFVPGIGSDIMDPEATELAYGQVPVATIRHLYALVAVTRDLLPRITCPLLAFQSEQDHVVDPANGPRILAEAGCDKKELVRLDRSYHVATLDHDRERIAQESLAFIRAHC